MDFWLSLPDFGFSNTMLYRTSVFRKVDAKVGGPDWWLKPYQIGGLLIGAMLYRTSVFRKVDAKVGGPEWWLKPTKLVAYLLELCYMDFALSLPDFGFSNTILCYTGRQYLEKLRQKWGTSLVAKTYQIGGLLIGGMLYGFLAFPSRFWVF